MRLLPFLTRQSARRLYLPEDKTAETQKSWFIFFQWRLNCVPPPAGGYLKSSQNGTADSDGGGVGAWSCHSQCRRPLSLHCQALVGCHGYPKSVCHPPWCPHTHTHRRGKTHTISDNYFHVLFFVVWTVAHFSFKITLMELMKMSFYMQKHSKHNQEIYSQIHW